MLTRLGIPAVAALLVSSCFAAADSGTQVTGKIQSVDAQKRQITIIREIDGTPKALEYDVSRKATLLLDGKPAPLNAFKPGQQVTLLYNADLEIVTRLEVATGRDKEPDGVRPDINVVASGTGKNEKEALHQAMMNAVQLAVGVVVDSETMVKNDEIITEQILTYSDAIVKKYDLVGKPRQRDGLITVKINAKVERRSLIERLGKAKITTRTFEGKDLAAEVATTLQAEKDAKALLTKQLEGFPGDLIVGEVQGKPQAASKDGDTVRLAIPVTFSIDERKYEEFSTRLKRTLGSIALDKTTYLTKASRFPIAKGRTVAAPLWTIMSSEYSPFARLVGMTYFDFRNGGCEQEKIKEFFQNNTFVFIADNSIDGGRTLKWNCYRVDKGARRVLAAAFASIPTVSLDLIDDNGTPFTAEQMPAVMEIARFGIDPDLVTEPEEGKFAWLSPMTLAIASDGDSKCPVIYRWRKGGPKNLLQDFAEAHAVFFFWPQLEFTFEILSGYKNFYDQGGMVVHSRKSQYGSEPSCHFQNGYTKALKVDLETTISADRLAAIKKIRVTVSTKK